jgi:hypothetical protein
MRSNAIRLSAKGEECTFQLPGVCSHNREETVLCHLPDESHGMARKSDDISAAYGCRSCHDAIDGRVAYDWEPGEREWYLRRAMSRTWRRLIQKGVIKIAGLRP